MQGVEKYGVPARVRGDYGSENFGILEFMRSTQGYFAAYIQGPSVHNALKGCITIQPTVQSQSLQRSVFVYGREWHLEEK